MISFQVQNILCFMLFYFDIIPFTQTVNENKLVVSLIMRSDRRKFELQQSLEFPL